MTRVFVVLVSTLVCSSLGLLIGHLINKAYIEAGYTGPPAGIILDYALSPIIGAGIGFGLSVITLKLFAPRDS